MTSAVLLAWQACQTGVRASRSADTIQTAGTNPPVSQLWGALAAKVAFNDPKVFLLVCAHGKKEQLYMTRCIKGNEETRDRNCAKKRQACNSERMETNMIERKSGKTHFGYLLNCKSQFSTRGEWQSCQNFSTIESIIKILKPKWHVSKSELILLLNSDSFAIEISHH